MGGWKIISKNARKKRERGNGIACQIFCLYSSSLIINKRSRGYRGETPTLPLSLPRPCRDEFPRGNSFSISIFPGSRAVGRLIAQIIANISSLSPDTAVAFFHCEIGSWGRTGKTKTSGNKKQRRIISITTLIKIQMKHLKTVRAE